MTPMRYRADIDGLRAIAVLMVVIFHFWPNVLPGGFIGVDVFFVISGFLITGLIVSGREQSNFSLLEFYRRRILRLLPALVLLLAGLLAVGWFTLLASEYENLGQHVIAAATFTSNLLLLKGSTAYFAPDVHDLPLLHLWSLGIEEQFYLVFPFVVILLRTRKKLLFGLLGLAVLSFAAALSLFADAPAASFYNPAARAWELLFGGAVFLLPWRTNDRWTPYLGLLLVVASGYLLSANIFEKSWLIAIPVIGAGLLLARETSDGHAIQRRLLSLKPVVYLGLISYPLYLWHWSLRSVLHIVESGQEEQWQLALWLFASVVLAILTYQFVEKPIRTKQRASRTYQLRATAGLIAALFAIGGFGMFVVSQKGLPDRAAFADIGELFRFDSKQSCEKWSGEKFENDYCYASPDSSTPVLAVIGDSHANALAPMFESLVDEKHQSFVQLGRGFCPMMLGGYDTPFCGGLAKKAYEFISRTPSIRAVFIASRWDLYLKNEQQTKELYSVLAATVRDYKTLGKKVYFILTVPAAYPPKACLDRPLQVHEPASCVIPYAVGAFHYGYRESLYRHLLTLGFDEIIDPSPVFCREGVCYMKGDGRIFYNDVDHLSAYGARHLGEAIRPWFNEQSSQW